MFREQITHRMALAIHDEMKRQGTAMISPKARISHGEATVIDGDVDLRAVAEAIYEEFMKDQSPSPEP